jgi:hypothetical protein
LERIQKNVFFEKGKNSSWRFAFKMSLQNSCLFFFLSFSDVLLLEEFFSKKQNYRI